MGDLDVGAFVAAGPFMTIHDGAFELSRTPCLTGASVGARTTGASGGTDVGTDPDG